MKKWKSIERLKFLKIIKRFERWRKEEQGHWRRLKILEFEGNEAYGCG